jgi:hypothetical protein
VSQEPRAPRAQHARPRAPGSVEHRPLAAAAAAAAGATGHACLRARAVTLRLGHRSDTPPLPPCPPRPAAGFIETGRYKMLESSGFIARFKKAVAANPKLTFDDPQFEQPMRCAQVRARPPARANRCPSSPSLGRTQAGSTRRAAAARSRLARAAARLSRPHPRVPRPPRPARPVPPPRRRAPPAPRRSIWWQVIPYFLLGAAEIFTNVGIMELFFTQVSEGMRALGTSVYLLSVAVGTYLASALNIIVAKAFPDNLWVAGGGAAVAGEAPLYFADRGARRRQAGRRVRAAQHARGLAVDGGDLRSGVLPARPPQRPARRQLGPVGGPLPPPSLCPCAPLPSLLAPPPAQTTPSLGTTTTTSTSTLSSCSWL